MDTRHFLLAEHYDSLGLYKVADSLENRIKTSQNTSDPSRGGLDDPNYSVQKPKPNINKKNVSPPTKQKDQQDRLTTQKAIDAVKPILEKVDNAYKPAQIIFLTTELNSLTKEATNLYLINLLENLSSLKTISSADMQKLEKVLGQVKFGQNKLINKEIVQMLENASNGIKPDIAAVQALKLKMPSFPRVSDLPKSATSWLQKMKLLKDKNPAQTKLVEKVSSEIAKKVPLWAKAARVIPVVFVLLNAIDLIPKAITYYQSIASGGLDEILSDAKERAKFLVFLADTISSVTMFIPLAAPFTSALVALSLGIQGGLYVFDQYKELSGEKEKEQLEEDFADNRKTNKTIPNSELLTKYGDNFYKNFRKLIFEYSDQLKTSQARYALRIIVYPEIRKMLVDNALARKKDFTIKLSDIMGLPSLISGESISERLDKNGNFVKRKTVPLDFIINPQQANNRLASYEFTNALKFIVVWANEAYKDLLAPVG